MRRRLLCDAGFGAVAALGLAVWPAAAGAASEGDAAGPVSVFVTVEGRESGIAEARVVGGRIERVRRIGPGRVSEPFKVAAARMEEGGVVVYAAAGGKKEPGLVVVRLPEDSSRVVPLEGEVSDVAVAGRDAIVAAAKGLFYRITPAGEVAGRFSARKLLAPPGRKGEHICVLPDGRRALVSFQRDDDDSPARGNRLVVMDLEAFRPEADIALPRDHPELHIPGDAGAQGPGPEVITFFPRSGTAAVTLDLYGAVLFCDVRELERGALGGGGVVAAAADGRLGVAFPDRAAGFEGAGREWLLVSNAAADGGLALFDVAGRRMARHFAAPAGAEPPVLCGGRLATVISGKIKTRSAEGADKTRRPARELHVFELPDESGGGEEFAARIAHRVFPLPFDPVTITAAGAERALVTGEREGGGVCALVELWDGRVADIQPLPGLPVRAAALQD